MRMVVRDDKSKRYPSHPHRQPRKEMDKLGRHSTDYDVYEMDVEGKFVFVGFTAKGIMPQVATPVGLLEHTKYKQH